MHLLPNELHSGIANLILQTTGDTIMETANPYNQYLDKNQANYVLIPHVPVLITRYMV